MSDQSLRDALEKLHDRLYATGHQVGKAIALELDTILNEHPSEPVGVSDEAVEAAKDGMWNVHGGSLVCDDSEIRAALEAAQPFMRPQAVASRQAVAKPLHDSMHGRLACSGSPACYIWDEAYEATDALFAAGVFRAPPTRGQIKLRLQTARGHRWDDDQTADAVLTLMGGAENSGGTEPPGKGRNPK